jgi:hypothetical protein
MVKVNPNKKIIQKGKAKYFAMGRANSNVTARGGNTQRALNTAGNFRHQPIY